MTTIKLFGVLRNFADEQGLLKIELTEGMTVSKFKTSLKNFLTEKYNSFDPKMIDESAIASSAEILSLDSILNHSPSTTRGKYRDFLGKI